MSRLYSPHKGLSPPPVKGKAKEEENGGEGGAGVTKGKEEEEEEEDWVKPVADPIEVRRRLFKDFVEGDDFSLTLPGLSPVIDPLRQEKPLQEPDSEKEETREEISQPPKDSEAHPAEAQSGRPQEQGVPDREKEESGVLDSLLAIHQGQPQAETPNHHVDPLETVQAHSSPSRSPPPAQTNGVGAAAGHGSPSTPKKAPGEGEFASPSPRAGGTPVTPSEALNTLLQQLGERAVVSPSKIPRTRGAIGQRTEKY